uniref:Uncharacterized protein n=1 Tax=Siphoviridae sp. ctAUQ2 TaxID=2826182 RepID=A0A8S5MZN7_9CAUD|nr:MAG TPA: hypothetical protein [Siphoviridae sp. ctAUQ2]
MKSFTTSFYPNLQRKNKNICRKLIIIVYKFG